MAEPGPQDLVVVAVVAVVAIVAVNAVTDVIQSNSCDDTTECQSLVNTYDSGGDYSSYISGCQSELSTCYQDLSF